MNLSEYFTLDEMTVTKSGFPNIPNEQQIESLKSLCVHILEPIRIFYKKPVIVPSAFRSVDVNRAAGGAKNSQHLNGEAADIHIPGINNSDLWQYIVDTLPFDQVIAEKLSRTNGQSGWVHVSYAPANRKDAISFLGNGIYVHGLEYVA